MIRRFAMLCACLSLAACAASAPPARVTFTPVVVEAQPSWREMLNAADNGRLDALPGAWERLYARLPARVRTAQDPLADPAAGLPYPELSPGSYRCRMLKLRVPARGPATARRGTLDFCYITATDQGFALTKQTGADPLAGYLALDDERYVFTGATQRRAGDNTLLYGQAPGRNAVGVVQRIANFRWRLALVAADASRLDILELTPVPADQQPAG